MASSGLFPLTKDGSLVHDPSWRMEDQIEWVENRVFDAGMVVMHAVQRQSGPKMELMDIDTGATYLILMRHFMEALRLAIPSKKYINGTDRLVLSWIWTFHRGGNCFFVRPCDGEA